MLVTRQKRDRTVRRGQKVLVVGPEGTLEGPRTKRTEPSPSREEIECPSEHWTSSVGREEREVDLSNQSFPMY